jgi:hypothetical protein
VAFNASMSRAAGMHGRPTRSRPVQPRDRFSRSSPPGPRARRPGNGEVALSKPRHRKRVHRGASICKSGGTNILLRLFVPSGAFPPISATSQSCPQGRDKRPQLPRLGPARLRGARAGQPGGTIFRCPEPRRQTCASVARNQIKGTIKEKWRFVHEETDFDFLR